ncbi:ricin-type beta-trefoil lectin domain protein [Streptomyces sp. ACA25]|uniref:ricin-type beta-trefoil lectin domain protein n=1 Tax=Streptomyces sp. ACA25 TaxID=3022596 RepID=UPI002307922C|nr:ricin-type beta-trefoil lectin domain protein [Streptomyces sp. ACA25]MDB1086085.1 ricin-type beta-trefoil lectin domain protein [Streptomyces sp. ACA25]
MPRAGQRVRTFRAAVVSVAALGLLVTGAPAGTAADESTATATPLSAELEEIRAAQAVELYGDPAQRPMDERAVSLASLGDSEISGEGVGNYEEPTDGPTNWCHRSYDAAIHRTDIPADVTYNFACSGANTENIRIGGTPQYSDELVQSDSLAIAARNTRVDTVLLVAGANDDLEFGPVMTDCVIRWFALWQGNCAPVYAPGWQARVDGLRPKVEATVTDLHTVMAEAGYARDDYRLILLGYPSPVGPDFQDNPSFPGKIPGGCTLATSDAAWGRDVAVPLFQQGMRTAAQNADATYLDASRLFHGHEVCMDNTWARGLTVDLSNPFPPDSNSVRQSFHPNYRGHGAFASCLSQLHASGLTEASCADPASTGTAQLYPGAWDDHFAPLVNEATGECADTRRASSRNRTEVQGHPCHGARNQGWWYDAERQSLHSELSHDRCLDVPSSRYTAGTGLQIFDCHGAANQKFTFDNGTLSPAQAPALCVTQTAAGRQLTLQPCDGSAQQRFA